MKSTWFGDQHRKQFAKLLHEADYSRQSYDVFETFLRMASGALRQGVNRAYDTFDEAIEEEWEQCRQRLQKPENCAYALAVLVEALEEKSYDFLGTVMQEWGMADQSWKGQCFTPTDLSRLTAEMTLKDAKPESTHRITLNEPACGAGSMVIAASQVLKEKGFYPWNYWWVAQDIDWRCVAMTYIQMTFLGIPGVVCQENTITLVRQSTWVTLTGALHPFIPNLRADASQDKPPANPVLKGQLSLF